MNLSLFIVILTNVINVTLFLFVLKNGRSDTKKIPLIVFACSIFFLILWSTANHFADTSASAEDALFWTRATFPCAFIMGWLIFTFSWVFPVRKGPWSVVILYALPIVLFSYYAFSSALITSVDVDPRVGVTEVTFGYLYTHAVFFSVMTIAHTFYNLYANVRTLTGRERGQVFSVFVGWMLFFIFAMMTNAILPLVTGNAHWSKFGPLGSIIMVGFIAYAIVRHEFLHIRVIVQRGLIYSVLLTLLITVYLALIFITHFIFQETSAVSITISAFITTIIGIFGVPPLTSYFKKITARIFFRDGYDYASVLASLAEVLNTHIVQDSIVKKSTAIINGALKVEHIAFQFTPHDEHAPIWSHMHMPLRSNKKHIGTLYLGKKRSDEAYTDEDERLLKTFADSAGVALEKAVLYRQVKEHAETLERKVEERTQEIRDIQKGQESMMLEISHGLQTPLTIMKGELFFLKKQGYEREKIETIDTSIDRISFFITKLLSLYRLDTTVLVTQEDIHLETLLTRLITGFKPSIKGKAIELVPDVHAPVTVVGDAHSLEEVCSNLIGNAIKYSHPERKNTITVRLTSDATYAHITVRDTGMGIQHEHLPHLFSKFYRVKDEDTKHIQGTGLGLVIAKKIVEMHGGTIALSSVYGEGTTITLTIPRTR